MKDTPTERTVQATVKLTPRDRTVLAMDRAALAAWLGRAFEAPCVVRGAPLVEGATVRADVELSTRLVSAADRAVLNVAARDQRLWQAWVEQSCVEGWCDAVNVSPSLQR